MSDSWLAAPSIHSGLSLVVIVDIAVAITLANVSACSMHHFVPFCTIFICISQANHVETSKQRAVLYFPILFGVIDKSYKEI